MGETTNQPFQLSFNAALKGEFQGSRVTSDSGLILVRELDERLGFGDLIAQYITDPRARTCSFHSPTWSGNQSTAAWRATRT
jgi:hypothetical protein